MKSFVPYLLWIVRRNVYYETFATEPIEWLVKDFFMTLFVQNSELVFEGWDFTKFRPRNFGFDCTKMILRDTTVFMKPKKVLTVCLGQEPFKVS